MTNTKTVAEIVDAFGGSVPTPHRLSLTVGDCSFSIHCNQAATRDVLAEYLHAFVCDPLDNAEADTIVIHVIDRPEVSVPFPLTDRPPEAGKSGLKEAWANLTDGRIVRKTRTGMVFVFGGGTNVAIGPCHALPNQVVNFINNRHIERSLNNAWQLFHAAGVCLPTSNLGICLSGFAGKGKSTLALELLGRGSQYLSNDRVLVKDIDNQLMMHGIAKYPRINPGTALADPRLAHLVSPEASQRYAAMPRDELWNVEDKHDVPVEAIYGPDSLTLSAQMHALVVITWEHDAGQPRLEPVDVSERDDLFPAFTKDPGLFYHPAPGYHAEVINDSYRQLLKHCAVFELTGGIDIAAGASLIEAITVA